VRDALRTREMFVVCGSGGTGKTTVSAALGVAAVLTSSARVLVLTVDPARRLATALGLGHGVPGNAPVRVAPEVFRELGHECQGELWVAMLDTKAGWDELVGRHAPDPEVARRLLANPLYSNITGRFVNSHDYIAMEQLHALHASGEYDLVVIDTPPSRRALDLLDAPGRMREFFGGRLISWLTIPARSRLAAAASRPFTAVADRVLGSRFLADIAEFFTLFGTMEAGFVERAIEVEALLSDERTGFVVVSTPEPAPVREARHLVSELGRRSMGLDAVVLNRTLPAGLRGRAVSSAAAELRDSDRVTRVAHELAPMLGLPGVDRATLEASLAHVLAETGERVSELQTAATRESDCRRSLDEVAPVVVPLPAVRGDVSGVAALVTLALQLR